MADTRTTRTFGVGQAKSGTASLVGLLERGTRAAHEPERPETLDLIRSEAAGTLSGEEVRRRLIARDARLGLEVDVAWANQFLVGHLLDIFPDARFVVLVRDPYTWLQSLLGHLLTREVPADVIEFLPFWFRPEEHPPTPHDRALTERGLFPLAAYLHAWSRHVAGCAGGIPAPRRLVLRTHELARSHERLAAFLQLAPGTLNAARGHRNRSTWTDGITSVVDRSYLEDTVADACGPGMTVHFPEVRCLDDSRHLWAAGE
ncbi:hypothetical protein K8I85_12080 [bacterium]|nr:hypothetical protein [bacterium]